LQAAAIDRARGRRRAQIQTRTAKSSRNRQVQGGGRGGRRYRGGGGGAAREGGDHERARLGKHPHSFPLQAAASSLSFGCRRRPLLLASPPADEAGPRRGHARWAKVGWGNGGESNGDGERDGEGKAGSGGEGWPAVIVLSRPDPSPGPPRTGPPPPPLCGGRPERTRGASTGVRRGIDGAGWAFRWWASRADALAIWILRSTANSWEALDGKPRVGWCQCTASL
jgi:hypothetical protein